MSVIGAAAALQPFQSLSEQLFNNQIGESDLASAIASLPPLDQPLLNRLATKAQQVSLSAPRHSWAMMATADAADRCADE